MTRRDDTVADTACSKQGWVLGQLTDDEAMDGFDDLPRGLQFHLNRCSSCRVLADRLMAVTDGLDEMVKVEPPPSSRRARTPRPSKPSRAVGVSRGG